MMHTEEQARETRCCGPEGCGNWHPGSNKTIRLCVASDCMGWWWNTEHNDLLLEEQREAYRENADYDPVKKPPMSASVEMEEYLARRCGYCGLAGKVE